MLTQTDRRNKLLSTRGLVYHWLRQ